MKRTITILSLLIAFTLKAQVLYLKQDSKHEKFYAVLKTKTFYFVLPGNDDDKEFKNVVDKYWKFTKYKIITAAEVDNNLSIDNVFFQVVEFSTSKIAGSGHSFTDFAMWTPTEKALQNGLKEKEIKEHSLGSGFSQLFVRVKLLHRYKNTYYNFAPGYLKNYLQEIQDYMNTCIEKGQAEIVSDTKQIKELKTATLYVPADGADPDKIESLFKKYKYKYERINEGELNKKILAGEKLYYMLTCIYKPNCKLISVINSETGRVVYNLIDAKPLYPYIVKGDISDINDEIEKADK